MLLCRAIKEQGGQWADGEKPPEPKDSFIVREFKKFVSWIKGVFSSKESPSKKE